MKANIPSEDELNDPFASPDLDGASLDETEVEDQAEIDEGALD